MAGHAHDLSAFAHSHAFGEGAGAARESALRAVVALTLAATALELAAGWWSGSLALTADGWHMGTHALALGGALLAYRLSARAARHGAYAFGGWKIEVLAGYTSALALLGVAAWLVWDSIAALRSPRAVSFEEALAVALIGLGVNLVCWWWLMRGEIAQGHAQDHSNAIAHGHAPGGHDHHDHNYRAALLHVLADALTSLLAIAALAGGAWFGAGWLDPAVAIVGGVVIARWAVRLLAHSAAALVDATADPGLCAQIRQLIETDGDTKVADLHVWQVGARAWCAAVSVVADEPQRAIDYRQRLHGLAPLRHVTIEVHRCQGDARVTDSDRSPR
jgi:cation diffusion facilitator family transporter